MDNSLKGLILAAGIIITCVVVGLGFYISRETKNTSSNGVNQITNMNSEYQDVAKTMYDGLKISGRELQEVLSKFQKEMEAGTLTITIHTGKTLKNTSTAGKGIVYGKDTTANLSETKDKTKDAYINPDASFEGDVTYDDNRVINGLIFTQQ